MLPFQSIFYNCQHIDVDETYQKLQKAAVFGKGTLLHQLQPASKTNARKLVWHVFVEDTSTAPAPKTFRFVTQEGEKVYLTSEIEHGGENVAVLSKRLRTKLPRHLLDVIGINYRILKLSRTCVVRSLLETHSRLPENALSGGKDLRQLVASHTPMKQVFLFIRSLLRKVLPKGTWGSASNRTCFLRYLQRILKSRRFDLVTLNGIVEELDVESMHWLKGNYKRPILQKFLTWLFKDYIFAVLKRFFYITEHASFKNRMFYYRKEVWQQVLQVVLERQEKSQVWERLPSINPGFTSNVLSVPDGFSVTAMTFFSARLIPKMADVRIVMLKREFERNERSLRQKAPISDQKLLLLLTTIWKADPSITGSSGFGINHVHRKWRKFVRAQRSHVKSVNYFVKVDVKHCFDTIPHDKLLEVLKAILSRFPDSRISVSGKYKTFSYSTAEVWQAIREKIGCFVMQMAGKFYLKKRGIPQGWKLACMLCNIFYGHLERQEFPGLLEASRTDHNEVLMRVLDDFLFVTTDLDSAVEFLRKLHAGFPEYGLTVNPDKTMVNFSIPEESTINNAEDIMVLSRSEPFPWFGHLFLTSANLQKSSSFIGSGVAIELDRYAEIGNIRDFISIRPPRVVEEEQYPCSKAVARSAANRISVICYDRQINSYSRYMRNVFELSMLLSLQWIARLYTSKKDLKLVRDHPHLCLNAYKSIIRRGIVDTLKLRLKSTGDGDIETTAILWVSLQALWKVLRKYTDFKKVLPTVKRGILKFHQKLKLEGVWATKKRLLQRATATYPQELKQLKLSC